MPTNEEIVRELYAAGEEPGKDLAKIVSIFAEDGYMLDMATGTKFRGQAIADSMGALASAFPDLRREILDVHVAGEAVVVEIAIRGTHQNELKLPSGALAPTGKRIDVPSCDVFHVQHGKITAFNCYNMASVMLRQLGAA